MVPSGLADVVRGGLISRVRSGRWHDEQSTWRTRPSGCIEDAFEQKRQLAGCPASHHQAEPAGAANGAIAGRAGTSPFLAVPFVNGRKEGLNASGMRRELRAAAPAGAQFSRARSVSVKVNRPRRSTSWTRVPSR